MRACLDCGTPFTEKDSKLKRRCAACQRLHKIQITKQRAEQRREEEAEKLRKKKSLANIQREAQQHGMSYGQYVARYKA